MYLRDTDSWLPLAVAAGALLIVVQACLPKDSDNSNDERESGGWDSWGDSYEEADDGDSDDQGDASSEAQDSMLQIDLSWDMMDGVSSTWNAGQQIF